MVNDDGTLKRTNARHALMNRQDLASNQKQLIQSLAL